MSSGSAHRDPFADYPCCKQVRRSTPGAGGSAGTPKREAAAGNAPGWRRSHLRPSRRWRQPRARNHHACRRRWPERLGCARNGPDRQRLEAAEPSPRRPQGRRLPGRSPAAPAAPLLPPPPARPPGGAGASGEQTAGPRAGHPSCARRVPRRPGISLKCNPFCSQSLEAKLIAKIFAKLIARTMSSWRRSVYKLFQCSRRNSPCKGALWLQAWLARGPGKTRAPK